MTDDENIIDLIPQPKQEEFIAAVFSGKYQTIVYGGAMGGGKTFAVCMALFMLCRKYPNSKWIFVRKSMPDIERTIEETFMKIYPEKYFKKIRSKPDIIFRGKNGSRIIFMAENYDADKDLNRFKGLECNGIFFEQVEEVQEKTFEMAHIRTGRWIIDPQPPKLVVCTVNPAHNWVKERFYIPYINGQLNDRTAYISAKISDNKILYDNELYMSSFDEIDSVSRARYLDGDWSASLAERPWAYDFNEKRHTVRGLQLDHDYPIVVSFDFNVNPLTSIIIQHGQSLEWVHIIEEIRIENSQIHEMAKRVARRLFIDADHIPQIKITGDFSGANRTTLGNNYEEIRKSFNEYLVSLGSTYQYSERYWWKQVMVIEKNPEHENSQTHFNTILYRHPEFLIDIDKCPYLIADLKMVESTADGKIDKGDRSNPKKQADFLDCARYFCHNFMRDWTRKLRKAA